MSGQAREEAAAECAEWDALVAERDAAIAERDRLREILDTRSYEAGLHARRMGEAQAERDGMRERAVVAEQERDRLRRELEVLREAVRLAHAGAEQDMIDRAYDGSSQAMYMEAVGAHDALRPVLDRLDAILRGES
jgi:hypothetical protein